MNPNDDEQLSADSHASDVERIADLHRFGLQRAIADAAEDYLQTAGLLRTADAELAVVMILTEFAASVFENRWPEYPRACDLITAFANRGIEKARGRKVQHKVNLS